MIPVHIDCLGVKQRNHVELFHSLITQNVHAFYVRYYPNYACFYSTIFFQYLPSIQYHTRAMFVSRMRSEVKPVLTCLYNGVTKQCLCKQSRHKGVLRSCEYGNSVCIDWKYQQCLLPYKIAKSKYTENFLVCYSIYRVLFHPNVDIIRCLNTTRQKVLYKVSYCCNSNPLI